MIPWLQELAADPARVRALTAWDWLVEQVTTARATASAAESRTPLGRIGITGVHYEGSR